MRKYFREYINFIAALIDEVENGDSTAEVFDTEFTVRFEKMLARLQTERLIHLLVTILFALLTIMTLGFLTVSPSLQLALLFMLFLILLIPYIEHYYFLENSAQKLYRYRDTIDSKIKTYQQGR
jgi:ABC-type transport system involved in cytochrome bd biosynthesis fused ATPase/permease subunit